MQRQVHIEITDEVRGPAGGTTTGSPAVLTPYQHSQPVAAAVWTVNHNLGRRPAAVQVLSPGFVQVDADVLHLNTNQLQVSFAQPQAGYVLAL